MFVCWSTECACDLYKEGVKLLLHAIRVICEIEMDSVEPQEFFHTATQCVCEDSLLSLFFITALLSLSV